MPKRKTIKKSALGRGLGSLLGEPQTEEIELLETSEEESQKNNFNVGQELKNDSQSSLSRTATQKAPKEVSREIVQNSVSPRIPDESRIWSIPIDKLFPNENQPRKVFAEDGLKELSASLKQKGVIQPILARRLGPDRFQIIAGERRWRAAQIAGLHNLPVILKKTGDQQTLELALIENIQRRDLNPIEEAEAYVFLIEKYKLTQQQLADQIGKDRGTIANTTRLLNLAPEIRGYVSSNAISMGHAKVLLAVSEPKLQIKLAQNVIDKSLNVRATEKLVQLALSGQSDNKNNAKGESSPIVKNELTQKLIRSLAEELQKTIGTKVSIDYSKGKGKIQVHFYSDEELNQLVENLKKSWLK